ncbi:hypothetical protein LQZ21_14025 [Treponema sp. TIM-1]|uniref:hypothetical protein n=1 Tax=Treponema sp. TIM-1 TaxID=2898417 RepID=UPI00397F3EB7
MGYDPLKGGAVHLRVPINIDKKAHTRLLSIYKFISLGDKIMEKEIESLKKTVETLQNEIIFLKKRLDAVNGEFVTIDKEINLPGEGKEPTLYDIKCLFRLRESKDGSRKFSLAL